MRAPGRRRPSSVDRLDPQIKELIGTLRIDHGWTIDEIRQRLLDMGQSDVPSRSALGRHVKSIEEVGAQLRESREIATALVRQVGDVAEDKTADLNIELMHSMVLRMMIAGDGEGDPEATLQLSRSLQSLASARKTNTDTLLRVRKEAQAEAAKKAVDAAKSRGITGDTVEAIRRAVLGSDA